MSDPVPPQLEDAVLTALGLVYVSGTACGEMCSVDSLGRLVRPCSASKSRRVRLRLADFICEVVLSGQIVGSMLIVAWVMSDPVNCELMGRLHKETRAPLTTSMHGVKYLIPVGSKPYSGWFRVRYV